MTEEELREKIKQKLKQISNNRRAAKSQGRDEAYIYCKKMERVLRELLGDEIEI